MAIEKIKILGAVLELPGKQHCQFSPFGPFLRCCLAGSSKTAPRILIFSIAIGADYAFYVKTIKTHLRAFLAPNILAIGRVMTKDFIFEATQMFPLQLVGKNFKWLADLQFLTKIKSETRFDNIVLKKNLKMYGLFQLFANI